MTDSTLGMTRKALLGQALVKAECLSEGKILLYFGMRLAGTLIVQQDSQGALCERRPSKARPVECLGMQPHSSSFSSSCRGSSSRRLELVCWGTVPWMQLHSKD